MNRSAFVTLHISLFIFLICWSVIGLSGIAEADEQPRVVIEPLRREAVVFEHATQACEDADIPDTPARAVRLKDGTVRLFDSHFRNHMFTGPDVQSVQRNCRVIFEGADDPDPAGFNDRLWITSTWTPDGAKIFALVHSEYQGYRHPGRCPSGRHLDCWYNAITSAVSTDGGRSFVHSPIDNGVVARLPYPYDPDAHRPIGYFNPSNIISAGGYFYVTVGAAPYRAQRAGNCLLRTRDPSNPSSWRAWDGTDFTVKFVDPYKPIDDAAKHVCQPVDPEHLPTGVMSLVRHTPSGAYLALSIDTNDDPASSQRHAIYVAASTDLVHWSAKRKVMAVTRPSEPLCTGPAPLAYPSLIDPASSSPNFETVGDTAQLFLTRFNLKNCRTSLDRDLIRIPVSIKITK